MTRAEAESEARRRNALPDAEPGFWIARRVDGEAWSVVHADAPGLRVTRPTGAHVESKPKPPEPDDPRSGLPRNVPGYG